MTKERTKTSEHVWEEGKLLSGLSTFKIGGPARYYVRVNTIPQMQQVLMECATRQLQFFILGKGSNSLFDDRGFDGVVIHNKIDFCEWSTTTTLRVGGGYSFALLGAQTARRGFSGLEFASGIPASVGGAVFMNAGANGQETIQSLKEVEYVDSTGSVHQYSCDQLQFRYRWSPFHEMKGAIVAATFHLERHEKARKQQLEILGHRMETQPYGMASAGCVFRNPKEGHSGALIESAGLKGLGCGDAQISEKHANFIVNTGAATATDVEQLIDRVRKRVSQYHGVTLEDEVRRIPYCQEDCHE